MIKQLISSIFKILVLASFGFAQANAQTTTAGILPLAKTQFLDQNGKPLTSGKVYFYEPSSTTAKTTWQDIGKTVANANPVVLDAGGRALIWGDGTYRQQVYDRNNNLQWDQTTASAGSSSSSSTIGDGLPVGTVIPSSGLIAPTNYQFAYGQTLSRAIYPELLAAITLTSNVTCVGGSPTITNISDTSQISVGTIMEASCLVGVNNAVISKTASTVTLNANANISLTSSGTFYIYGNGDGSTTFNVPDYRGVTVVGRCNMGGVNCTNLNSTYFSSNASNTPSGLNAKGGSQSSTLLAANLPPHTHTSPTLNDPGHSHTTSPAISQVFAAGGAVTPAGGGLSAIQNLSIIGAVTGITLSASTGTNASGTSTPVSLVQPSTTVNYVIKVSPDVNLTSTYGVAAIGGMTGIISCGTNVTCSGNTISVPTVGGFGNPSALVGTTPINGALGTAMRSDGAPAINQAMVPTWTGAHTWSGVGIGFSGTVGTGVNLSGATYSSNQVAGTGWAVNPAGNISQSGSMSLSGTFTGSGGSALFDLNQSSTAASAASPEIGAQFTMSSNVGTANKTTAYKIGLTSAVVGGANSANVYGANIITQGLGGAGQYLVTGIESDVNNVGTDASATLLPNGGPNVFNFVAAGGGTGKVTAHYWSVGVFAASAPRFSFAASGIVSDDVFHDESTVAQNILRSTGNHQFGINLFAAVLTGGTGSAFISPNNIGFGSANAAGSATIALLNLDGSNILQHGATTVVRHQFNVNPGGPGAAITMNNSHSSAGDIVLQLQGGAATAIDVTTLYLNMVNSANTVQRGQIIAADAAGVGHVAYQTASDERLKRSLGPLDNPIDRLMSIEVHRYQAPNYKGDDFDVGFFAQNLYRAYPWAVTPSKDPDFHKHPWQVDYGRVTPLLVAATQEMQHEISNLHSRLDAIEHRSSKRYHHHP